MTSKSEFGSASGSDLGTAREDSPLPRHFVRTALPEEAISRAGLSRRGQHEILSSKLINSLAILFKRRRSKWVKAVSGPQQLALGDAHSLTYRVTEYRPVELQ
ncbi:hypothetical protein J6590_018855 [Homalodisca vitripennis]|nr:hypothetical protein J6590_018855 [Homalodisca vitripennis]